jgi:hypothetical protein
VRRAPKRMSRLGGLAEGEELSSNPLRAFFNGLRTTQMAVDVDWRIMNLLWRVLTAAMAGAAQPVPEHAVFGDAPAALAGPSGLGYAWSAHILMKVHPELPLCSL